MKCPQCRFENTEGATICAKCRTELGKLCPQCYFLNPSQFAYCGICGSELTASQESDQQELSFGEKLERIQRYLPQGLTEKVLSQKDKIEGERRQVTIMFCDMKGFTPLTEKLGPEETFALMDRVYEILIHKVHEYEGTVNELRGDGILALFGAPIALEDAPQRAILASIAIHSKIAEFNQELGKEWNLDPILLRIGINTGIVVVGSVGNDLRVQFTAMGDTINMASRMESLAEPGTTYVTEETYRLTKGLFQFKTMGRKAIKGKETSTLVYKVLSGREDVHRPRLGTERRIYSELVGRDLDLDKLELHVMKVINGEGSIINIMGEAGIGKSRLVAELKKREGMKRVTLLEGRAISIGRNLSFYPVIDIFKQWSRINDTDSQSVALGKLETALRYIFPNTSGEVLPFVATLMGIKLGGRYAERVHGLEGEALEKLILKSVRELVTRISEQDPLVIVMEDMHWADASSIELMESLFRLVKNCRIMFINVFRPGEGETGHRIRRSIEDRFSENSLELMLQPLDTRQSESLIHNMLSIGGPHHHVLSRIVQRTGGNPFFIEEIVRSFIDQRLVVLKEGKFQLTEKISDVAIPNSINDVLMARFDRLDEETRNLLKIASVIGRNFFYRILSSVATTVDNLEERLSDLKKIQLIRERTRIGEVEYLFKHALAQEAAYESILPFRRRELHREVAVAIENVFSGKIHEFYGMLAYHYSKAENIERAEEYLIKAGEEALKSSASNEALHYYQEALSLYLKKYGDTADSEKVAMIEKNIALALFNKGRYEEAVEHFDRALQYLWGKLPQNTLSTILTMFSASCHLLVSIYQPSLKFKMPPTQRIVEVADLFYKKCKALSMIDPKGFLLNYLCIYREVTRYDLQNFKTGLEIFMGVSSIFSFTGISYRLSGKVLGAARAKVQRDDVKMSIMYDLLETIHNYLGGNWDLVKDHDEALVTQCETLGEIFDASQHLYWHGLIYICQGRTHVAESVVRKLDEMFKVYENDLTLSLYYGLANLLLVEYRKLHEAIDLIQNGISFAEEAGLTYFLVEFHSSLSWVYLLLGNVANSEACLEKAIEIRKEVDSPVPFQLVDFSRSRLEFDLYKLEEAIGRPDKSALRSFRKKAAKSSKAVLKIARKVAHYRTDAYRLTGRYCWLTNKQKEALAWWERAIAEGERLNAHLQLSRAFFEIGNHLLEADSRHHSLNGIRGEEYLSKAETLFKDLRLEWDLDALSASVRGPE